MEIRATNCFDESPHVQEDDIEYFVIESKTHTKTRITGDHALLKKLKPGQVIRVKGNRKTKLKAGRHAASDYDASPVLGEDSVVEAGSMEIIADPVLEPEIVTANGAPTLKMLSCLLVFASSTDYACMTSQTNAKKLIFENPTNANLGMQSLTKGKYGLQLGNGDATKSHVVTMALNVSSVGKSSKDMEALVLNELPNVGYSRYDYNRVLIFPPGGITDSNFTAYAYYGSLTGVGFGKVSVYGSSYGNSRMNGYLHELGHNFGFAHSSKGSSEYGDRTCVMGTSNDATESENYNAAKMIEAGWLDTYPGTHIDISSDAKLDLYSLHIDPLTSPGAMAVAVPGTPYYVAYRVDGRPYGKLSQTGDRNRVFVYTKADGSFNNSYQVANLGPGQVFTGTGLRVIFGNYGSGTTYASVLFDVADANAIPYAAWQSVSVSTYRSVPVTLSATDADGNALTYSVVSGPTNGALSGSAPNLVYTPVAGYVGGDKFTFKANDGTIDSNIAEVDVTVNPASAPAIVLADDGLIAEAAENGEVITITLFGDTFVPTLNPLNWSIANQPAGVSKGTLTRVNDTTATLTLSGNRTADYYFDIKNFMLTVNAAEITSWTASEISANSGVTFAAYNAPPTANAGMDLSAALTGNGLWTPAGLTTQAWYDAADTASLTLAGGKVSQWNDRSGNSRHVSQSTPGQQPTFASQTVSFDGVDDLLMRSGAFMYANGGVDIYVAGAFSATTGDKRMISESSLSSNNPTYLPFQNRSSTDLSMMSAYIRNDGGAVGFTNTNSLSPSGAFALSARKIYQASDTGSSMAGRVDGGSATTVSYTRSGTMTLTSFGIGGIPPRPSSATGSAWMRGDLNEVIIVPGLLGDPDRQKVEGYLAHKWGLSANLPAAHPYKTAAPGASKATVNLTGTASDPEFQALITTWSVISGPAGASIGNSSLLSTTATFGQTGVYVLRFTVSDGYSSVSDDLMVTVNPPSGASYSVWAGRTFANPFTDKAQAADPDGDGMSNLMEYAMGTDPTSGAGGALKADGTAHGSPIVIPTAAGDGFDFVFIRRDDHGTSGGVNYIPQFSADLQTFYDSAVTPTIIANSVVDPDYEVVKVPYPSSLPDGKKATFGRLLVTETP